MENPKINSLTDIRQSPEWGEYLKSLGWRKHSPGDGKSLYSLKTGPLVIAKMQRPVNLSTEDLAVLDELAYKNKFAFIKLEPSSGQDSSVLERSDYKISLSPLCPPSTIVIDLENPIDTLRDNLSKSARYSINRSKREGGHVEVQSNPNAGLLNQIYPVLKDTAKLQKFLMPGFDDLKTKLDLWKSECHVATVKNAAGVLCGTNIFLSFNGNVWHIHGGTTEEGRKTKLGYLLLWKSIIYLKNRGYKLLDLEGKDDKRFPAFTKTWGGFSYFKEKFGGTEIQYPYPMIKYYSPVLKLLSRVYSSAVPL